MSERSRDAAEPATNSKVGRLIEKYGLAELGNELEARWKGTDRERFSLRELADYFNRELLGAAMTSAGIAATERDVEHVYSVLTDSDVSSEARVQKRRELERDGIPVDELEQDFVSHQAVHTYLRKYRGAEYENDRDRIESATETLQRLRSRTTAVTERTVESLANVDRISVGSFDVFADIRVHCSDCGGDYGVVDLLKRGGCDC